MESLVLMTLISALPAQSQAPLEPETLEAIIEYANQRFPTSVERFSGSLLLDGRIGGLTLEQVFGGSEMSVIAAALGREVRIVSEREPPPCVSYRMCEGQGRGVFLRITSVRGHGSGWDVDVELTFSMPPRKGESSFCRVTPTWRLEKVDEKWRVSTFRAAVC